MSRLHFIDFVRPGWWGDATLVESDGRYLLMDTCHEEGTYIIKYLKDYGVKTLDLYVSHDHHDHWGRIVYFINNFKVGKVYLPVDMQGGARARQITEAARANGTKVIYLQKGSTFTCGRWKFTVVYRKGKGDPNDRSLVVIGEGDGVRFFTAGDLSAAGEKGLLGSGADIHADIYKLSHHGDGDTNSEAVIKKVDPSIAVCNCNGESSGTFRSWADRAYKRVEKYANIYSVRYNGTVVLDCRNGVIHPSAERNLVTRTRNGKAMKFCKKAKVLWRGNVLKQDKTDADLAVECFLGLHGNGADRKTALGKDYDRVQETVNELAKDEKRLHWAMADYVLKDHAGNGQARIDLLKEYYGPVQVLVDRAVEAVEQICSGDNPYGNGDERIRKLTEADLDYDVVQGYINRNIDTLLKK